MAMEIKGMTLKSRVTFLEHVYGPQALHGLLPHLKGTTKGIMSDPRKIMATSWYPFTVQLELDGAICRYLAGGEEGVFRQMGAFSADYQETYSAVDQFSGPVRFLKMHETVFPRFFRPGRMTLVREGDRHVIMQIHEFRSNIRNCLTNLGFIERGLQLCGCGNVRVRDLQCQEHGASHCAYDITWG